MKDIRFVNLMTSGSVISEVSSSKSFIQVKILPVSCSTGVSFTVRQENQWRQISPQRMGWRPPSWFCRVIMSSPVYFSIKDGWNESVRQWRMRHLRIRQGRFIMTLKNLVVGRWDHMHTSHRHKWSISDTNRDLLAILTTCPWTQYQGRDVLHGEGQC